ncbi:MAG: MCE family protein [Bacteroidia bacterium]
MKNSIVFYFFPIFFFACGNGYTSFVLIGDEAEGLDVGAPLMMNSIVIGHVKKIRLNEKNAVEILCRKKQEAHVPLDSRFTIQTDLIGFTTIAIQPGTEKKMVGEGAMLHAYFEAQNMEESQLNPNIPEWLDHIGIREKQDSILLELRRLNKNLEQITH